jgi:predicted AlkP superfamily pyrophosphatase or phosphodiesterase
MVFKDQFYFFSGWLRRSVPSLFLFLLTQAVSAQDTAQQLEPGRQNNSSQMVKPYVILISVDGFRYDYAEKYKARILLKLASGGAMAKGMRPAFPSLTFPNHYSIITGLYPAHHGLVDNMFFDRRKQVIYNKNNKTVVKDSSWYGGIPLWVLAEEQQMLSASMYWVGGEARIRGIKPTYYYSYTTQIPLGKRLEIVRDWLNLPEEKRPHFISLYFSEIDNAGHLFGPESPEIEQQVQLMDSVLGNLVNLVNKSGLPVNFIFVSDHGMIEVNNKTAIGLPKEINKEQFVVPPGDALLHLYARHKTFIRPTYKSLRKSERNYKVYLRQRLPKQWKYNLKNDRYNRIGDIVLIPVLPDVFNITGSRLNLGRHGFDPAIREMKASFFAWGPSIKEGVRLNEFEIIHVYPLIANILGLHYSHKIDGDPKVLGGIMTEN